MNLGDVVINGGSLAFAESLTLGNPNKTITINPGAAMQLYDLGLTNPIVREIFMTDARLNCGGGDADTNVVNGSIHLAGANAFKPDQAVLIINGPIVGSSSLALSANEPGRVYLNGNNTYAGDTTVTNGTLGGIGTIAGNLTMLGGTNSPGAAAGSLGTFTVNGNVALAGTTLMELNRTQSPNSDRLSAGGSLTFGGTLTVVLGPGAPAPQGGDVYQLFNKAGGGSFAAVNLPDLSALPGGLSWDTNNLSVNGSITVIGAANPPTISGVHAEGGNLIFSGTGGVEGNSYFLLSTTNLSLHVTNWTVVSTNLFGVGGTFSCTNSISPSIPETFYLLQLQ
jgi:autotransporter-associated beta strand protein